jgi:hypothetical protein
MENVISKDGIEVRNPAYSAARLAGLAGTASVVFLGALHILSPEIDPTWRMVSEYALGKFEWVLALMFVSQALSCLALFFALKAHIRTIGGKIGLFFLLAACVGLVMAALFDWEHPLHGVAALIGMPSSPIAAMVLTVSLIRNQKWSRALLLTANLTWISLVIMLATVFTGLAQTGGQFGPEVLVGIPNRLVIVTFSAWLISTARQAAKLQD